MLVRTSCPLVIAMHAHLLDSRPQRDTWILSHKSDSRGTVGTCTTRAGILLLITQRILPEGLVLVAVKFGDPNVPRRLLPTRTRRNGPEATWLIGIYQGLS